MKRLVPEHVRDDLALVVDYLHEDERKHFKDVPAEERKGHVYPAMERLRSWLQNELLPRTDESKDVSG